MNPRSASLLLLVSVLLVSLTACSSPAVDADEIDDALFAEDLINTQSDEIVIFYPSTDTIVEERVTLDSDVDAPLQAVRTLFAAEPEDPKLAVTLPPAEVLGLSVSAGTATVDFSAGILDFRATENVQRVALASVLYTLQQFPDIEQVEFTVEGQQSGSIEGQDIATFWGEVTLRDMPWSLRVTSSTEGSESE